MKPSEWREDATQAAEDLYDLMGDAEDNSAQKLHLLRSIRSNATELALRTYFTPPTPVVFGNTGIDE